MPHLYVDGEWVAALHAERRLIVCPATGESVGEVAEGSAADTDRAIAAARRAFDHGDWAHRTHADRAALLNRVADLLARDKADIAKAEALDTGKRLVEAEYDVDDVISVFRHFAGLPAPDPRPVAAGRDDVESAIYKEPVGVCGLIAPWNYPLLQLSWKVAPCLLAGNTFVAKPSELTPHSAIHLMRLLTEVGLPAGVGNLVLGTGPEVGAPLATDPRVDLISFTGSLPVGRWLMAQAAQTVKKVALELGGKNPNIIFADTFTTDLKAAVLDNAATAVFLHSGQVCSAGARLLVEQSIHDEVVAELVHRAQQIRMGTPFDPDAETGALISAQHLANVQAYVDQAVAEGAELRCGGHRVTDDGLGNGYFFAPTVLTGCTSKMAAVQEESFGPVLTVEKFTSEAEAIALANDTIFGLAGAVWTSDPTKAERVARALRIGTVWINDYHPYVAQAEWGGYKQSGFGRELGHAGLDEYQETKHVWRNTQPSPSGWFSATGLEFRG